MRSIAIASGIPFKKVYKDLFELSKEFNLKKTARYRGKSHPGNAVHKKVYHDYILSLGATWVPKMSIGSGCTVHLKSGELPGDKRLVVSTSKHLTSVINGVINDTFDPSRDGKRCVYGYYIFE